MTLVITSQTTLAEVERQFQARGDFYAGPPIATWDIGHRHFVYGDGVMGACHRCDHYPATYNDAHDPFQPAPWCPQCVLRHLLEAAAKAGEHEEGCSCDQT